MISLPNAADFEREIRRRWADAAARDVKYVDIRAGDVHTSLGGYPSKTGQHRMPDCCQVMKRLIVKGDTILNQPPSGQGASLVIRYILPRP